MLRLHALALLALAACGGTPETSAIEGAEAGQDARPDVQDSHDDSAAEATVADAGTDGDAAPDALDAGDPWDGAPLGLMASCDPGAPHCGTYGPHVLACTCSSIGPGCWCSFECADAGDECPYFHADAGGIACSPWCAPDVPADE